MTDGFRKDSSDDYASIKQWANFNKFSYDDIRKANETLDAGVETAQLDEMFIFFRDVLYESRKQRSMIEGLGKLLKRLSELTGHQY